MDTTSVTFLLCLLAVGATQRVELSERTCQHVDDVMKCPWRKGIKLYEGGLCRGVRRLQFDRFWEPAILDISKMVDIERVQLRSTDVRCEQIITSHPVTVILGDTPCEMHELVSTKAVDLTTAPNTRRQPSHESTTSSHQPSHESTPDTSSDTTQGEELTTDQMIFTTEETTKMVTVLPKGAWMIVHWANLGTTLQLIIIAILSLLALVLCLFCMWIMQYPKKKCRRRLFCMCCLKAERTLYERSMELSDL